MAALCEILSELRKDCHLSQKQMAEMLHVSAGTISNYETGRYAPNYDTLIKLADFFDVSTDYLLGRTSQRLPISKLNKEYYRGKSVGELMETILSIHEQDRELVVKALELIQVYDSDKESKTEKRRL